ncbi:unnamed protein product [Pleuronectes platessa]|uniref:Uncharacterized protein n=1 Tax=Pleuronectes platessa TaxID=8262 RepID=A0A9N7V2V6_PLEPL|nr:unnamed protein product [Pleuronectes platessa]
MRAKHSRHSDGPPASMRGPWEAGSVQSEGPREGGLAKAGDKGCQMARWEVVSEDEAGEAPSLPRPTQCLYSLPTAVTNLSTLGMHAPLLNPGRVDWLTSLSKATPLSLGHLEVLSEPPPQLDRPSDSKCKGGGKEPIAAACFKDTEERAVERAGSGERGEHKLEARESGMRDRGGGDLEMRQ